MTDARGGGNHSVSATYDGVRDAERAVRALERLGVEGGRISMEGPGVERAEERTFTRPADKDVSRRMGRRVLVGSVIGGAAGVVVGVAFWLLVPWVEGAMGFWGAVLAAVLALGGIGGLVAGFSGVYASPASQVAGEPSRERVRVIVHVDDARTAERAEEAFRDERAVEVSRGNA